MLFYCNNFNPFACCFLFLILLLLITGFNPDALFIIGVDFNSFPIFNFFIFLTPLITSTVIYYKYLFYQNFI